MEVKEDAEFHVFLLVTDRARSYVVQSAATFESSRRDDPRRRCSCY